MSSKPPTGYFTTSRVSPIDGSAQPFALWVPRTLAPRRRYPLIVALHGSDADHRMIPEDCFRMNERGFRDDVIFLSPFGRGDIGFRWMGEADVWEAMNWVKARYPVDARRQYLTGLSMGGYATWRLACDYSEQWAAIAPVCGGGEIAALRAMKGVPVWCVHGEHDDSVPVGESRQLIYELRRLRSPHRYDELAHRGHDSWEWLYDPERADSLADWFLQFQKDTEPKAVTQPKRHGHFKDLFNERIIVSHPARSDVPGEVALLRKEAEEIAAFDFGDFAMRRGRLIVRSDADLTADDLDGANHLMLGRTDNHRCIARVQRKLIARHVKGQLRVRGETYLGKTLLAATLQPSPWNKARLLGVVTYQQAQQMRGVAERFCGPREALAMVNVYDTQARRFILREE